MSETTLPGEQHGHAQLFSFGDYIFIFDTAAGLHNNLYASGWASSSLSSIEASLAG